MNSGNNDSGLIYIFFFLPEMLAIAAVAGILADSPDHAWYIGAAVFVGLHVIASTPALAGLFSLTVGAGIGALTYLLLEAQVRDDMLYVLTVTLGLVGAVFQHVVLRGWQPTAFEPR